MKIFSLNKLATSICKLSFIKNFYYYEFIIILTLFICGILINIKYFSFRQDLVIRISSETPLLLKLHLYTDTGKGFNENECQVLEINPHGLARIPVSLKLQGFRLDPEPGQATQFTLENIHFEDLVGNTLEILNDIIQSNDLTLKTTHLPSLISTSKECSDPWIQFSIDHNLKSICLSNFLVGLLLLIIALIIVHYSYNRFENAFKNPVWHGEFVALTLLYFFWTLMVMLQLVMVLCAEINTHPDEKAHWAAASYFQDSTHKYNDSLDQNAVKLSQHPEYKYSYLSSKEITHYFLGRISRVFLGFHHIEYFKTARLINLVFFSLCILILILMIREHSVLVFSFFSIPQVWYIASYVNGDSIPLSLFILMAALLIKISLRKISFRTNLIISLLATLILLILFYTKPNYILPALFLYVISFVKLSSLRLPHLNKLILFFIIISTCFVAISPLSNNIQTNFLNKFNQNSFHALMKMTVNTQWYYDSFRSFLGGYGWMMYFHDTYILMIVNLIIISISAFMSSTSRLKSFCFITITILIPLTQSLYFSTFSDYQPQGRYLFPVIPMLIYVFSIQSYKPIMNFTQIILVSLFSFFIFISFILTCHSNILSASVFKWY